MKKLLRRILQHYNYEILKCFPISFSKIEKNILLKDIFSKKNDILGKHFILNVSEGRTNRGYKIIDDPICKLFYRFNNSLIDLETLKTLYIDFYRKYMNLNVYEKLSCKLNSTNDVTKVPTWLLSFPWENVENSKSEEEYRKQLIRNRISFGKMNKYSFNKKYDINHLRNACISSHVDQYIRLINSIRSRGLLPHYNSNTNILCDILVDDFSCWWKVGNEGNHRVISAASLGHEYIPVKINNIIYKKHVKMWPNVINNAFSIEQSIDIFNTFIDGKGFRL